MMMDDMNFVATNINVLGAASDWVEKMEVEKLEE
jgi:hypothetical protein